MEALMHKKNNLSAFFSPSSIAVVGASGSTGKISGVILESLRNSFRGAI
jgi:acyl-CoA synthetase (NDP forming)